MHRKAAFEKKKEYNTAFKCATIVYGQEKGKEWWYVYKDSCRPDQKRLWNQSLSPNITKEGEGR